MSQWIKTIKLIRSLIKNVTLKLTRNVTGQLQRSMSPSADTSSGQESAKQLGTVKVAVDQPSSGSEKVYTGTTGHASSVSHQPGYGQFSTSACAYPPDTEDPLFVQISDEDVDQSGSFSGSDDGQLLNSTGTPEQTEDMTYRETVRSVRWAGIIFQPLSQTIQSQTNPIIPGRANNLLESL